MSILSAGDMIADRYEVEGDLGRGGMQEVYVAWDTVFKRKVALKTPQDDRAARSFHESAVISARINHPGVAKTLDYHEDSGRSYLIEEIVEGGTLRSFQNTFDRLDPHTVLYILHHLARGVAASHAAGVVHRDLKPSNILVSGGVELSAIKITDFGIAKMAAEEIGDAVEGGDETTKSSRTLMNQIAYIAPEIISKPREASKPADVWAIAAIAWELLTGAAPFGNGLQVVQKINLPANPVISKSVRSHPQFGALSIKLADTILRCFARDPSSRPTAAGLVIACGEICYMSTRREQGRVEVYTGSTTGRIAADAGHTVFFHTQSVLGEKPAVGCRVWFASFPGEPMPRAMPVVPMRSVPV